MQFKKRPNINQISSNNTNIQKTGNYRLQTQTTQMRVTRSNFVRSNGVAETAKTFMGSAGSIYITFGGVGDLMLLLAECYKDKSGKVLFFANNNASIFGRNFLKYFKLNFLVLQNIMGGRQANDVVEHAQKTGRLATSAHLADDLDYGDWKRNTEKYKNRMIRSTDWLLDIGKNPDLTNKKSVVIAPCGSFRVDTRQRYILPDEYTAIVKTYLNNGYLVYSTGGHKEFDYYPKIINENHYWLMSDKLIHKNKNTPLKNFGEFLQIINSSNVVVSVDTWLKTYACLAGLKTRIMATRYHGGYEKTVDDPADTIFLNPDFWPTMQIHRVDEFVLRNCFCLEDAAGM